MTQFKRENRYLVFKNTDIVKALTSEQISVLASLANKITLIRKMDGKSDIECVVIESDWPEYEPTWDAIKKRVESEDE